MRKQREAEKMQKLFRQKQIFDEVIQKCKDDLSYDWRQETVSVLKACHAANIAVQTEQDKNDTEGDTGSQIENRNKRWYISQLEGPMSKALTPEQHIL